MHPILKCDLKNINQGYYRFNRAAKIQLIFNSATPIFNFYSFGLFSCNLARTEKGESFSSVRGTIPSPANVLLLKTSFSLFGKVGISKARLSENIAPISISFSTKSMSFKYD